MREFQGFLRIFEGFHENLQDLLRFIRIFIGFLGILRDFQGFLTDFLRIYEDFSGFIRIVVKCLDSFEDPFGYHIGILRIEFDFYRISGDFVRISRIFLRIFGDSWRIL